MAKITQQLNSARKTVELLNYTGWLSKGIMVGHRPLPIKLKRKQRVILERLSRRRQTPHWLVQRAKNRGFDLIFRKPHPNDPHTAIAMRFIEVKGRSGIGQVALTMNEYKTAERLKQDYRLDVVFNCASTPEVHPI